MGARMLGGFHMNNCLKGAIAGAVATVTLLAAGTAVAGHTRRIERQHPISFSFERPAPAW